MTTAIVILAFVLGLWLGALAMAIFTIYYLFDGIPSKTECDEIKHFAHQVREIIRERQVMQLRWPAA